MKIRVLVALVILFAFTTAAAAQSYTIRVTYNTNLRVRHSLDASSVETVPAGTTLQVIGTYNRWLEISRDGRDVWMASWVAHTRVEGQQPVATDIDNCCFVNRQCASDQEWTDGYWAYQRNECPVSVAPPVSNVVAPPEQSTAAESEVNNCCHIGWDCETEDEWIHGYKTYQSNQCENPGVAVIGSDSFTAVVLEALRQLRSRSAYWYAYTVDGLDNIREASGTRIWVSSGSADVSWGGEGGVISRADIGAVAALLVHEACHVHRGRAGLQPGGLVGERDCLQKEIQVLDTLGLSPGRRNYLQNVLANINDRAFQWWH